MLNVSPLLTCGPEHLVPKRRLRRFVAVCAEWKCNKLAIRTVLPIPIAVRRAEHTNIGLAVAVEVARRGHVGDVMNFGA